MMDPPPMRPSAAGLHEGQHQRTGKAGSAVFAWLIPVAIAGCSSNPPTPDWKINAQSALERGASAWLEGRTQVAEREFNNARQAIASTGRLDLLARAELARCAALAAGLQFEPCDKFEALRADAAPAERAYAAYLSGRASAADAALLPEQHRPVAGAAGSEAALQAIKDPLARQIAAGVLLRSNRASPAVIDAAIDNASAQGWRRPLLAWLKVQEQRAQAAGDAVALDALRRRITLVESAR